MRTSISPRSARTLARGIAAVQLAAGGVKVLLPSASFRAWSGEALDGLAKQAVRAEGARDLALGLGILASFRHGARVRGWVEAAGMADAGDALVVLMSLRSIEPRWRRGLALSLPLLMAAAARLVSLQVDRD